MAARDTTYCPSCGERISARARFCPACGARQEDFHVEAAPGPPDAPAEPPQTAEPGAPPEPPRAAGPDSPPPPSERDEPEPPGATEREAPPPPDEPPPERRLRPVPEPPQPERTLRPAPEPPRETPEPPPAARGDEPERPAAERPPAGEDERLWPPPQEPSDSEPERLWPPPDAAVGPGQGKSPPLRDVSADAPRDEPVGRPPEEPAAWRPASDAPDEPAGRPPSEAARTPGGPGAWPPPPHAGHGPPPVEAAPDAPPASGPAAAAPEGPAGWPPAQGAPGGPAGWPPSEAARAPGGPGGWPAPPQAGQGPPPPGREGQAAAASAQAPPRQAVPIGERIGRVDPQAAELSELLMSRLAVPGMVAAGVTALLATAAVLAAGLLIAVVTPDASFLGVMGLGVNPITEAFRQGVGTLLAPVVDRGPLSAGSGRLTPMLLVAVPVGAIALGTRWQLRRTEGGKPLERLAWATVVAVPFSLLMLACAILAGDSDVSDISPSPGACWGLGLLWGFVGALIGAATALPLGRREGGVPAGPPLVRTALTAAAAALRPLAAVLVTCTAIALVGWLVQVGADVGNVRAGRSAPTALVEEAVYGGEHGVHLTALAAGAKMRPDAPGAIGLPFPVEQANDVPGPDGGLRIFSYSDAMPAWLLLPALVVLMGLVALGALYAGFAAARTAGAGSLPAGAGWGAITGPAWAIAMAILVSLAGGVAHGDADGGSVFGVFLLGGALLGAAGGALAVSGAAPAPARAGPPAPGAG